MKWFYKKNRVPMIIGIVLAVFLMGYSMTVWAGSTSYPSRAELEKMEELMNQGYAGEIANYAAKKIVNEGYSESDAIAAAEKYYSGSSSTTSTPSTPATPVCSHEWVVTDSVDATCIAEGSITYTCSKCGKTKTEAVAKNEHTYELTAQTEATCKDKATETYTCSVCGDTYTLEGELGNHIYTRSAESVEATCEEAGTTVYVCSVCGDTYSEDVPALGHDYSQTKEVIKAPTCTEEGVKAYICKRCGVTKEEEPIPATGHTITYKTLEAPTFLHKGKSAAYCTTCNQTVTEHQLPMKMPVWFPVAIVAGLLVIAAIIFKNFREILRKAWKNINSRSFILLLLVLIFAYYFFCHMICNTKILSGSMEPTLMTGNFAAYNRLAYINHDVQRGDVIAFWSEEYDSVAAKRAIGIAGDHIEFIDGSVFINGEKFEEPYLTEGMATFSSKSFDVPEGCVFVLGDSRYLSLDSREFANPYIPETDIIGKFLFTIKNPFQ